MKIWNAVFMVMGMVAAGNAYAKDTTPAPKHDTRAPIEVTSDKLDVFQNENKAIFSGNVVAIQTDTRLKADTMTVYYRKPEEKPGETKPKKAPANPKVSPPAADSGAIKKIDAEGSVFLSTPQETASGDHGTYDVENQQITLSDHVVLTRDKNVLKGDKLVYNFDTGKSVLTSGGIEPPNASTPWRGPQKGRVHALFVPDKDDKNKAGNTDKTGTTKQ